MENKLKYNKLLEEITDKTTKFTKDCFLSRFFNIYWYKDFVKLNFFWLLKLRYSFIKNGTSFKY